MGKTKVTLDTNILISASGWQGNPKQIFEKIIDRKVELVVSYELFSELSQVLEYPKFQFTEEQKSRLKELILKIAKFVKPVEKIDAIKEDVYDNSVLECGVAGSVDYIVTGDLHLLKLKEFRSIKIVTAKKFLEEIKE